MDGAPIELEKNKFNSLIDKIREGVVILTPDQNISQVNDKAVEMLGYTQNEMIGKPAIDIFRMINSDDKLIEIDQMCPPGGIDTNGVIFKAENVSLVDKNNMVRVVDVQSLKITEGSNIGLGAMVVINDVFKEGELERMKTDFVSMAVHMLRTPLTIIKGYLANLLRIETVKKLTEPEMTNLTSAISGTDELGVLIENLLHMSEIQRGSFKIHASIVSYDGLIARLIAEFKPSVESKGLQLIYIPPLYELPMLELDFMRIREVLRNLFENGVKFTEKGGIEVTVFKEEDKKRVHTVVRDTGKGIPQVNLDYIFTKFYRIKDPLEMEHGLGLGLFISRKIIEAHGGEMWAESIEGEGSVFHFTLPIPQKNAN